MRLLSEDDLRWVTGGCESHEGFGGEHCVVQFCPCYESPWLPVDDYDDPPPASSGPPPAPPPPQDDKPPEWNECLDRKADTLAKNIHDEIAAKGDKLNEWGALIWKDASGTLHRTELVQGGPREVDLFARTPQSYGFESWSQVIGMVHSHPTHTHVTNTHGTEDTSDDTGISGVPSLCRYSVSSLVSSVP